MGARVNFGCGTIVVNYDGRQKHRATVGDDAFIGCNSNLLSPVTLEANSYVAAGSTVSKDVPEDALGIARARQVNLEGWVARRDGRAPAKPPTAGRRAPTSLREETVGSGIANKRTTRKTTKKKTSKKKAAKKKAAKKSGSKKAARKKATRKVAGKKATPKKAAKKKAAGRKAAKKVSKKKSRKKAKRSR